MLEQGHLVAPLAFGGKQHGIADPEIRNAAVPHFIKVIGGFLPGKGVVVVDVDGLVGGLRRLAHNDMEQPFIAQICRHRAVLFGVEQDKPICLCVGHHALDGVQHLGIDQIWCSKAVAVKSSRVVFSGLQEPQVSDHAGVMIEL